MRSISATVPDARSPKLPWPGRFGVKQLSSARALATEVDESGSSGRSATSCTAGARCSERGGGDTTVGLIVVIVASLSRTRAMSSSSRAARPSPPASAWLANWGFSSAVSDPMCGAGAFGLVPDGRARVVRVTSGELPKRHLPNGAPRPGELAGAGPVPPSTRQVTAPSEVNRAVTGKPKGSGTGAVPTRAVQPLSMAWPRRARLFAAAASASAGWFLVTTSKRAVVASRRRW